MMKTIEVLLCKLFSSNERLYIFLLVDLVVFLVTLTYIFVVGMPKTATTLRGVF